MASSTLHWFTLAKMHVNAVHSKMTLWTALVSISFEKSSKTM